MATTGIPYFMGSCHDPAERPSGCPCPHRTGIRKLSPWRTENRKGLSISSGLGQIELAAHREALVIWREEGMPALIGDRYFWADFRSTSTYSPSVTRQAALLCRGEASRSSNKQNSGLLTSCILLFPATPLCCCQSQRRRSPRPCTTGPGRLASSMVFMLFFLLAKGVISWVWRENFWRR